MNERTLIRSTADRQYAGKAKKLYHLEVANMTELTSSQCESLECGDIVLKKDSTGKHAYLVSFKKDKVGMCITYTDASVVETVSYDCVEGVWTYNSTDVTHITG